MVVLLSQLLGRLPFMDNSCALEELYWCVLRWISWSRQSLRLTSHFSLFHTLCYPKKIPQQVFREQVLLH